MASGQQKRPPTHKQKERHALAAGPITESKLVTEGSVTLASTALGEEQRQAVEAGGYPKVGFFCYVLQ